MGLIGARVKRVEDPRILRGRAEFVDDLPAPDAVHVALVRSPYAHARIMGIDRSAALALPGVVAVETAETLGSANGPFPHPTWFPARPALAEAIRPTLRPEVIRLLPHDRVRFAGEAVAVVAAADRYLAEDAARLVDVAYQPLPVVADPEAALEPDAPLLDEEWGSNLTLKFTVRKGDVDEAFRKADHVVAGRFRMARQTGGPLEARGVLARPERRSGGLTVWSSTQTPHWLRDALVVSTGLSEDRIRVVAPDVGGGFGTKSMVYPEELLAACLALRLERPVRWTDTRRENFSSAIHSRAQRHDIELALSSEGRITGLRDSYLIDCGSGNLEALVVPYNTTSHLQNTYAIANLQIECTGVLTNKAPLSAYRGAGRPEAIFAVERILDRAARALGLDRAEIRRRNFVAQDEMPYPVGILYRDGTPMTVDGGDYEGCLREAVDALGAIAGPGDEFVVGDIRRAHGAGEADGPIRRGLGVAMYIEGTGIGPFERAHVLVHPSGGVTVTVALPSQGQGHETTLAQVCSQVLGVPLDRIRIAAGDTLAIAGGGGTIASRTAVVVGNAVAAAARAVRERALRMAAEHLEAAIEDLVLEQGRISVTGSPDRAVTLAELARATSAGIGKLESGGSLEDVAGFEPPAVTFASGAHACAVAVDMETGAVTIERYVVVHDCGRLINPLIVDGQVQGGVAQGIGAALLEELVYDTGGQLLSGSYMDYGMPRSTDVPVIEVRHRETPSTRNPLGLKGVGEAGTIAVPAAIASAIEDALRPLDVTVTDCPMTPERIHRLIDGARAVPGSRTLQSVGTASSDPQRGGRG